MKMSLLKSAKDEKNFKFFEHLGFDVYKIHDLEQTDLKIKELIKKEYNTIILSNEVASFSGDIIKKYSKKKDVNIIITPKWLYKYTKYGKYLYIRFRGRYYGCK